MRHGRDPSVPAPEVPTWSTASTAAPSSAGRRRARCPRPAEPAQAGRRAGDALAAFAEFPQGVASGEPGPRAIALWTHVGGGGGGGRLGLEVARDPGFARVVHSSTVALEPRVGERAIQVRLSGAFLAPGEEGWYRFFTRRLLARGPLPHRPANGLARARPHRRLLVPGARRWLLQRARRPRRPGRPSTSWSAWATTSTSAPSQNPPGRCARTTPRPTARRRHSPSIAASTRSTTRIPTCGPCGRATRSWRCGTTTRSRTTTRPGARRRGRGRRVPFAQRRRNGTGRSWSSMPRVPATDSTAAWGWRADLLLLDTRQVSRRPALQPGGLCALAALPAVRDRPARAHAARRRAEGVAGRRAGRLARAVEAGGQPGRGHVARRPARPAAQHGRLGRLRRRARAGARRGGGAPEARSRSSRATCTPSSPARCRARAAAEARWPPSSWPGR